MNGSNWRMRAIVLGGIVGAVLGATAATLYVRSVQKNTPEDEDSSIDIQPSEAIAIGLAVLAVMRQIAQLPENSAKRRLE